MQDYRVELDAYSGPLDLLLFLVRRNEIDLNDIPIARLTEQYLEYLRRMQQVDINLAGEFLIMAATLLEIKSAMLVPQAAGSAESDSSANELTSSLEQLDPRYELVRQLLAYKRFKDAAGQLDDRRIDWERRYPRLPGRADSGLPAIAPDSELSEEQEAELARAAVLELDLEDVHVLDLCEAFARVLESIGRGPTSHEVVYDDTPIGLHADDIVDRLSREGSMSLQAMFVGRSRGEAVGLFLAMLELVRQKRLRVVQDAESGQIHLELRPIEEAGQPADADAAANWTNPQTGQIEYEWPSEEARLRAERRARLRASRAAKGKFGKPAEGEDEDDLPAVDLDDTEGVTDEPANEEDGRDEGEDAVGPRESGETQ